MHFEAKASPHPFPCVPLPHQPGVATLADLCLRRAVDYLPCPADITPAEFHFCALKRPMVEHAREGLLQPGPPLCTYLQRFAAGDVTQIPLRRRLNDVSAPGAQYCGITSTILGFAHTRTLTHPGAGIGGCVCILLYFSTRRERFLSICTGTGRTGAFSGRLIVAAGAGNLR